MRPEVLLIMNGYIEDCDLILRGISRYQRERESWKVHIDKTPRADLDPAWVAAHAWSGVISRVTTPSLVQVCAAKNIPLIDLDDSPAFPGVTKIRSDNRAIGHMAAEDLYERGYRQMYFCGYPDNLWSNERRDGFFEALRLLDCEATEFSLPHGCGGFGPTENAEMLLQMTAWLKTLPRPAAIMAAHDSRGYQLLSIAEQIGLRAPDDLAVIGVNNDATLCEMSAPPLSSVETNMVHAGYLAAETLAKHMRGEKVTEREILLEPIKVVSRRSTDALAFEDLAISRALSLIREKACEGITPAGVMHHTSISRSRLERGFRRYVGRSPQAEIQRVRFACIKQLLKETDFPLKQIAVMTGYEHVEYLNVSFKRVVGETPGRFRRIARLDGLGNVGSAA